MTTTTLEVNGMTCNNCVGHVTDELKELQGVQDVDVALVAGGTSTVTIASSEALPREAVTEALDEAGGYQLVSMN